VRFSTSVWRCDSPICGAVSAALHTPNWGYAVTGAPNSAPSPLSPPKKASTPQIEIWSTRNRWSWGSFERKVLRPIHYSYFWPFSKQTSIFTHYSYCWAPLEVRYFTHYSCYWGPLWKGSEPTCTLNLVLGASKRRTYTLQLLLLSLWKLRTYTMQLLLGALVK